jgi:CheY-like chemotaxis protein
VICWTFALHWYSVFGLRVGVMVSRPEAVLIVDDDDLYVRALTRQLRSLGFPFVYRAASAQQALAMLERVHPTLVLTDMVTENQRAGREVIASAKQLGASVAVVSGVSGLRADELGVPLYPKSDLIGDSLEDLVFELIGAAQQRSRDSVRASEQVA